MTIQMPTALLWLLLFTACIGSASVLVVGIPRLSQSLFRHALWRLRDELYDDLRAGVLPRTAYGIGLLDRIETTIRCSKLVKIAPFAAASVAHREDAATLQELEEARSAALRVMSPEEAVRLHDYEHDFAHLVVRQMTVGSPLGWLRACQEITVA